MRDTAETITPELLLRAYRMGVFPMAETRTDPYVMWIDPRFRGVIPMNRFYVSRSLARVARKPQFCARMNANFAGVVSGCAARQETWISHGLEGVYLRLHEMGFAHSFEVYDKERLVGGMYGVILGAAFFGESMFSEIPNGSKLALAYAVGVLGRAGIELFDTQFITEHLSSLGAIEISQNAYRVRLARAISRDVTLPSDLPPLHEVVQRRTHRS